MLSSNGFTPMPPDRSTKFYLFSDFSLMPSISKQANRGFSLRIFAIILAFARSIRVPVSCRSCCWFTNISITKLSRFVLSASQGNLERPDPCLFSSCKWLVCRGSFLTMHGLRQTGVTIVSFTILPNVWPITSALFLACDVFATPGTYDILRG